MILEFSVTNFLSFKEKATFSMCANNCSGFDNNYVNINNKKVLKTAALYGANASGKSNLFKILNNVIKMIRYSSDIDVNAKLPIIPFKFDNSCINKPSEFEIKFIVDGIRYVYGFVADKDKIYEEYLYNYPNGRETKIFDRTNISKYSYNQKDEKFLREIEKKNTSNKFFLSTSTNWNFEKTKPAYDFLTTKIGTYFNIAELKNIAFDEYKKDNNNLRNFALEILEKTDFNIVDYNVSVIDIPFELFDGIVELYKKPISNKPKAYQVMLKHRGDENYLTLDEESMGTQNLFAFIPFIVDAINNGKVIVVDELDKSLHPFLVQYIVEMFNNPDINKKGAQLIFNTHDTNLLNLNILRRDQIWFTEKNNDNGESELYSLSDFSVRKFENIEKCYMLGRYGAVPFIKNDLNLWQEE